MQTQTHRTLTCFTNSSSLSVSFCRCAGSCYASVCSLKFGHPACCHVPHRSYDDGYYGNKYAAVEDIKDVKADLLGFWKGRDFYCWR